MRDFSAPRVILYVGIVVGLLLGLVYTWYLAPLTFIDTYPALLRDDYRRDWIRMAAFSYVADGDLERVRWRLRGLDQQDVAEELKALIDEGAAAGRPADTMRRLTTLAQALGVHTEAMLVYLDTPLPPPTPVRTPPPMLTPLASFTPVPTVAPGPTPTPKLTRTPRPPTPTPLPPSPFRLVGKEQICKSGQPPHIEVVLRDELGEELAGIEVWLMWVGGADRAVTGLKPQSGVGYVDFDAEPGVDYMLGTSELGVPLVTGLRIESCPPEKDKEPVLGSWRIVLERQPLATVEPAGDAGG